MIETAKLAHGQSLWSESYGSASRQESLERLNRHSRSGGYFKCEFSVGLAMGDLSLVSNLRIKSLI